MNQDKQPEVLRLADALEKEYGSELLDDAADRLRRLHAESEQHMQELAAYRFTVDNLRARVAELEAQLAAAPQAAHTKGVFVDAGALQMVLNALERDAIEGKQVRAEMRLAIMQSVVATHPNQLGLDAKDAACYRWLVGARNDEALKNASNEQPAPLPQDEVIAWMAGNYFTKNDADAVIIAAQAKQGEQA